MRETRQRPEAGHGTDMTVMYPARLISVENEVHAQMIAGVLEGNGIKCWIRDKESGGYMSIYTGFSVFGKDLYVDEADVVRARELVDGIEAEINTEDAEKAAEDEDIHVPPNYRNRRIAAGVIAAILGISAAAALILNLYDHSLANETACCRNSSLIFKAAISSSGKNWYNAQCSRLHIGLY